MEKYDPASMNTDYVRVSVSPVNDELVKIIENPQKVFGEGNSITRREVSPDAKDREERR
jgi:hypothetical protein